MALRSNSFVSLIVAVASASCAPGVRGDGVATTPDAAIDGSAGADTQDDVLPAADAPRDADLSDVATSSSADVGVSADGSPVEAPSSSDAAPDASARDGSALSDAQAGGAEASPGPMGCVPGPPGPQRPPFAPPPAGCGSEAPGRRPTLAQQVAKRPTCPSPRVVETAMAPSCPLANPNDTSPDDDALQA